MTKDEAIRILEQICPKRPQKLWSVKRKEAVKMAIEALTHFNSTSNSIKNELNDDLISRQSAIDAFMNDVTPYGMMDDDGNIESGCKDKDVIAMLYKLPSANPDLSGYSDRLWKRAYDRGYERCRQDAIDGAEEIIKRDTSGNNDVVKAMEAWKAYINNLPSAQPVFSELCSAELTCEGCKYEKNGQDLCYECCRGCGDMYEERKDNG